MCEAQCNTHFLYCLSVQYSLIQWVFIMKTYWRKKLHAKCHRKFRIQFPGVSVSLKSSMSNSWSSRPTHIYVHMSACMHTLCWDIRPFSLLCIWVWLWTNSLNIKTIGKATGMTPQPVWQSLCPFCKNAGLLANSDYTWTENNTLIQAAKMQKTVVCKNYLQLHSNYCSNIYTQQTNGKHDERAHYI